jgi:hypothetical protein
VAELLGRALVADPVPQRDRLRRRAPARMGADRLLLRLADPGLILNR